MNLPCLKLFLPGDTADSLSSSFQIDHDFEKIFQEYLQCQAIWSQIRPDVLIWVQTVCKGSQQTILIGRVN